MIVQKLIWLPGRRCRPSRAIPSPRAYPCAEKHRGWSMPWNEDRIGRGCVIAAVARQLCHTGRIRDGTPSTDSQPRG